MNSQGDISLPRGTLISISVGSFDRSASARRGASASGDETLWKATPKVGVVALDREGLARQ